MDDDDYNSDEDEDNDFTVLRRQAVCEQVQNGTQERNESPAASFARNVQNWTDNGRATPVDRPRTRHRQAPQVGPPNVQNLHNTQPRDRESQDAQPNAPHLQVAQLPAQTRRVTPRAYSHQFTHGSQVLQPRSPRVSHVFAQTPQAAPPRVWSMERPHVASPPPRRSQRSPTILPGVQLRSHEPTPFSNFPTPVAQTIWPAPRETSPLDSPIQHARLEVRTLPDVIQLLTQPFPGSEHRPSCSFCWQEKDLCPNHLRKRWGDRQPG
jgi:hypothetical protein